MVSASEVKEVIVTRQRLLTSAPRLSSPATESPLDLQGLLAYDPTQALSDGGAQEITEGLVDVNSCPPWDLWVGWVGGPKFASRRFQWFRSYLLAWIPVDLRGRFDAAICTESAMALAWWRDLDCDAYHEARAALGG